LKLGGRERLLWNMVREIFGKRFNESEFLVIRYTFFGRLRSAMRNRKESLEEGLRLEFSSVVILNLSIDTPWADKSTVEVFNVVCLSTS
jgi:hypothetical protein